MPRTEIELAAIEMGVMDQTFALMQAAGFDDKPRDVELQGQVLAGVALALGNVVLATVKNDPQRFVQVWSQMGAAAISRRKA